MTFNVGDIIEYKTSRQHTTGEIVCKNTFSGVYFIEPIKKGKGEFPQRRTTSNGVYTRYKAEAFEDLGNGFLKSRNHVALVSMTAKKIKKLEFTYDPNQQADEEDDI